MKYITTTVIALALFAVFLTLFIWWDTAESHGDKPKYQLADVGSTLGPETHWPIQPGPAIHTFYCVGGGPKNCGHIHTVPEPGTLALTLLGLALVLGSKTKSPF